jgi:hypothetical protein
MAVSRRFIRFVVVGVLGVSVLVLSPMLLFDRLSYHFGADELRAAVEGTWVWSVTPEGGPAETLTFRLAQGHDAPKGHAARSLVRSADACGNRSLVRTAGACIDTTDMPLEVTVIADGPRRGEAARGELMVAGTRFESGSLTVRIGELSLYANVTPQGKVESLDSQRGDRVRVSSTLVRIAR